MEDPKYEMRQMIDELTKVIESQKSRIIDLDSRLAKMATDWKSEKSYNDYMAGKLTMFGQSLRDYEKTKERKIIQIVSTSCDDEVELNALCNDGTVYRFNGIVEDCWIPMSMKGIEEKNE